VFFVEICIATLAKAQDRFTVIENKLKELSKENLGLNEKVELWVREYPDQWLWYHDRWDRRRKN